LFGLLVVAVLPSDAGQIRSGSARADFKREHPCPVNGPAYGPCHGYIIDHIEPLACCGADAPSNMQWQTASDDKAKDRWELL
jgi:hypothetical protein